MLNFTYQVYVDPIVIFPNKLSANKLCDGLLTAGMQSIL